MYGALVNPMAKLLIYEGMIIITLATQLVFLCMQDACIILRLIVPSTNGKFTTAFAVVPMYGGQKFRGLQAANSFFLVRCILCVIDVVPIDKSTGKC